jgi:Xaa-Pro aminopeptidase
MSFTNAERERRYNSAQKLIATNNLEALMLTGDVNNGKDYFGDFRYFSGNKIICNRQVVVIFKNKEYAPVLFASSLIQTKANERRSFVKDCRYTEDLLGDVLALLKEREVTTGRVGVNLETTSAAWYLIMREELPAIDWVEVHPEILKIRDIRSDEEVASLRRCAQLCDAGFAAALKMIKPGVNESEVAAEIEYAARKGGAEDHFTLIGSGKFSFGEGHSLYLPYDPPSIARKIEKGDSVVMEITPRYNGYWTQLVRTVNVGDENKDLADIHKVCVEAIQESLKVLKPGNTISDSVKVMGEYINEHGYIMSPPLGHVCGVDLIDGRVAISNTKILTPGMSVIIHPTLYTLDRKVSFFWGQTYIITEDGCENLMISSDELLTV